MKQLHLIIILLMAVACSSCEKNQNALSGTKWGYNIGGKKRVVEFLDNENVRLYVGNEDWSISGSVINSKYTQSSNRVEFTPKDFYVTIFYMYGDTYCIRYYFKYATIDAGTLVIEADGEEEYYDNNEKEFKTREVRGLTMAFYRL